MPDLNYVSFQVEPSKMDLEASIARALELYAADPGAFSDPVGIIDSLADSSGFRQPVRRIALVLIDPNWSPPQGITKEKISGGSVLSTQFDQGFGRLDSCWNEILNYARNRNYEIIPPGIEIYRGYDSELASAVTELIIRIK